MRGDSKCRKCGEDGNEGRLNGYGECRTCANTKINARIERIKREQPDIGKLGVGDTISIAMDGIEIGATVNTATNYGDWDGAGWYIEFTRTANGRYGYWKQGEDGGTVRLVKKAGEK